MIEKWMKYWSEIRIKGKRSYILSTGISFGLFMFVFMGLFEVFFSKEPFEEVFFTVETIYRLLLWLAGGIIYGIVMWHINNRRYYKYKERDKNNEE